MTTYRKGDIVYSVMVRNCPDGTVKEVYPANSRFAEMALVDYEDKKCVCLARNLRLVHRKDVAV